MFLTRLKTTVTGHTGKEAVMKFAPDGRVIAEFTLGVGGGSAKFPVQWVKVAVWKGLVR